MNVIIRTGFQKISHKIQFQPETMSEGKALVEAGHARFVQEEHKIDVNYYTISANIIRQASASSTSYSTKLIVSKSFKMFNYLFFLKLYNQEQVICKESIKLM